MVSPSSVPKFLICVAQFRNWIPASTLVSNYVISNSHSAISKLHKFANCAEHIHVCRCTCISVCMYVHVCHHIFKGIWIDYLSLLQDVQAQQLLKSVVKQSKDSAVFAIKY